MICLLVFQLQSENFSVDIQRNKIGVFWPYMYMEF